MLEPAKPHLNTSTSTTSVLTPQRDYGISGNRPLFQGGQGPDLIPVRRMLARSFNPLPDDPPRGPADPTSAAMLADLSKSFEDVLSRGSSTLGPEVDATDFRLLSLEHGLSLTVDAVLSSPAGRFIVDKFTREHPHRPTAGFGSAPLHRVEATPFNLLALELNVARLFALRSGLVPRGMTLYTGIVHIRPMSVDSDYLNVDDGMQDLAADWLESVSIYSPLYAVRPDLPEDQIWHAYSLADNSLSSNWVNTRTRAYKLDFPDWTAHQHAAAAMADWFFFFRYRYRALSRREAFDAVLSAGSKFTA